MENYEGIPYPYALTKALFLQFSVVYEKQKDGLAIPCI